MNTQTFKSTMPAFKGEIRALPVFDALPEGCIAVPVMNNRCEPVIHSGEFAVVDTSQRQPVDNGLFHIRYTDRRTDGAQIVQVWKCTHRGVDGETFEGWWTGQYNRPRSYEVAMEQAKRTRKLICIDGPYPVTGPHADYLASRLRGRVIGILEAAFEGDVRAAA